MLNIKITNYSYCLPACLHTSLSVCLPDCLPDCLTAYQGDQMIRKQLPNFLKVAKYVAKQNNAKLENIF